MGKRFGSESIIKSGHDNFRVPLASWLYKETSLTKNVLKIDILITTECHRGYFEKLKSALKNT